MAVRNPHRRLLVSLLLAGVVVVAGAFAYLRFATRPATSAQSRIPAMLTVDVKVGTVSCPSAIAWAPDGARLAVLAQRGGCDAGAPDTILLYDATDGTHRATIDLSGIMAHAHAIIPSPALSWSPDGTLLAVPVLLPGVDSAAPPVLGLLLIPVNDAAPQIVRPAASTQANSVSIWNADNGLAAANLSLPLAPAITYRWTTDGQITAEQPFPTGGIPSFTGSPVVQPDSVAFPLWQSGTIISIYPKPSTPRPDVLPAYYFVVRGGFWSPHEQQGVFVAPNLTLGPWPLPGTPDPLKEISPVDCTRSGILPPCGAAVLPMPDRAFAQVAHQITRLSSSDLTTLVQGNLVVPLAWRPDGKVLAAMLPGDSFSPAHDSVKVSLLATATGQTMGGLTLLTHTSEPLNPLPPPLFWSPTGHQLAFMDSVASRITIWGGISLPQA